MRFQISYYHGIPSAAGILVFIASTIVSISGNPLPVLQESQESLRRVTRDAECVDGYKVYLDLGDHQSEWLKDKPRELCDTKRVEEAPPEEPEAEIMADKEEDCDDSGVYNKIYLDLEKHDSKLMTQDGKNNKGPCKKQAHILPVPPPPPVDEEMEEEMDEEKEEEMDEEKEDENAKIYLDLRMPTT